MRLRITLLAFALAMIPALAAAQSSTNYKISDHALNNGGGPHGGLVPSSTSFQITLDSIGDTVGLTTVGSASFQVQGSFVVSYRPPGEVLGLDFLNSTTLVWEPEPSVGEYQVYRSEVALLPSGDTGLCLVSQLPDNTVYEPSSPVPGQGWFYLVTARNRLAEEGTKGYRSNGSERPNLGPCP